MSAQEFSSGEQQVPLIELYTSEGCSSCPPADRWMSKLKSHKSLWSGFVPVALHVDYWDYIGWKDPFASREYSQRQRQIARENDESTVYTPGVRKAGEEWQTWRLWGAPTESDALNVGNLNISVGVDGQFHAEFDSNVPNGRFQLNVAVLGIGLSTDVKRGENRGKVLHHDFVVLGLSHFSSAQAGKWSGEIARPIVAAEQYAIAAWVSHKGRTKPLQATGGYLLRSLWPLSL